MFLPSCSDDKNEPDDPNKGVQNPTLLPEVVNGVTYMMEFPFKITYENDSDRKVISPVCALWTAGRQKPDYYDECQFQLSVCFNSWGKGAFVIFVERTDGDKLYPDIYSYLFRH